MSRVLVLSFCGFIAHDLTPLVMAVKGRDRYDGPGPLSRILLPVGTGA